MDKIYRKSYPVHYYEVDFRGLALPQTILNYLQDAAGDHASVLGFSVLALLKKKMTWLLSRYHVRILRPPRVGDVVRLDTWPSGKKGIFALRDFEASDAEGRALFRATSSWLLWNIPARQPAGLEENLPDGVELERRAIDDPFAPLPGVERIDREAEFRVWMQDIDFNRHVNHASYILWALETPPEDVLRSSFPGEIEVAYKAEAFYGDEIVSRLERDAPAGGLVFRHALVHKSKGTELARLRTAWTPV
jgi:medium-chain acyl-[acyl-carrier-protein] hydrolase